VGRFPLDQAAEVYHLLHDGKIAAGVVITPNG
jgi:hypothetical protein